MAIISSLFLLVKLMNESPPRFVEASLIQCGGGVLGDKRHGSLMGSINVNPLHWSPWLSFLIPKGLNSIAAVIGILVFFRPKEKNKNSYDSGNRVQSFGYKEAQPW